MRMMNMREMAGTVRTAESGATAQGRAMAMEVTDMVVATVGQACTSSVSV